jgi:hypothetical protein
LAFHHDCLAGDAVACRLRKWRGDHEGSQAKDQTTHAMLRESSVKTELAGWPCLEQLS